MTKAHAWHVDCEIVDLNPPEIEIPEDYFKDYVVNNSNTNIKSKVRSILKQQKKEEIEQEKLAINNNKIPENSSCGSGGCGTEGNCGTGGGCGSGGCGSCGDGGILYYILL